MPVAAEGLVPQHPEMDRAICLLWMHSADLRGASRRAGSVGLLFVRRMYLAAQGHAPLEFLNRQRRLHPL